MFFKGNNLPLTRQHIKQKDDLSCTPYARAVLAIIKTGNSILFYYFYVTFIKPKIGHRNFTKSQKVWGDDILWFIIDWKQTTQHPINQIQCTTNDVNAYLAYAYRYKPGELY